MLDALSRDAGGLLDRADCPWASIVRVDYDSILFLGLAGDAHTAWLDGPRVALVESGFIADAPRGLHAMSGSAG